MPLSWNEIKDRALAFSRDWAEVSSEDAEAKSFWDQFFNVFGLTRRRVASFEEPVKKLGGAQGFVDLFWKGELIVEHKSRGKSLDKAYTQAIDYFSGIAERDLPKRVLVSDFATLRLYLLDTGEQHEFALADLHKNVGLFAFIAGYTTQKLAAEDPVNRKAAERMGRLHDALKASGFEGHALEVLLVRLLFCLFAEDTGIFQPRKAFQDWVEQRTADDGSDLGPLLAKLFQVLDTDPAQRSKTLDEQLAAFPYVNGALFKERIDIADFNRTMREALLDACALDWSQISPAIFGALFQSIMDEKARRNLGAHYTSERNILKLIKPLFLDALRQEFDKIKGNRNKLFEFHKKLRTLTFFDPACGCGNFLVIAYRELRLLELDVLRASRTSGQLTLDVHALTQVDVDQFYGIEIEEFPAQIAQVALWLTDHQLNLQLSEEFGLYFARIPLKRSPHIVHGNALTVDWDSVLPRERCSYVMGNPPFLGKQYQDDAQKADLAAVMHGIKGAGVLDFVAGWYVKTARYLASTPHPNPLPAHAGRGDEAVTPSPRQRGEGWGEGRPDSRAAFVSTNSITQGEQVAVLWGELLRLGVKIHFAHRTFQWSNEGRGVAAVHCVIVGFGLQEQSGKVIYDYRDIQGEPQAIPVRQINPYLVDAPNALLEKRRGPLVNMQPMLYGSKPVDGGHLIFTDAEREQFLLVEPAAEVLFRRFLGAEELINGNARWCLWLVDTTPQQLRALPCVMTRIEAVRAFRLASPKIPTQQAAGTSMLFAELRQPDANFLAVPEVSSERREYLPIGYLHKEVIASNLLYTISNASLSTFGILQSTMHMAWVRAVCGRLKSDFRYSAGIVYNNFPWPVDASDKQRATIEEKAQAVLTARAEFANSTLADLYDPLTMPPTLRRAHDALDKAVDAAYGKKGFASEAERVAFLFGEYQRLTSLLPVQSATRRRRGKVAV